MQKTLLLLLALFLTCKLFAQNDEVLPDCKCNSVDELIMYVFGSNIQEARSFLGADSDPFGISMSVKVRIQNAGDEKPSAYMSFNTEGLESAARDLVSDQKFDQFDMENPGRGQKKGDVWIYEVGVVPHGEVPKDSREHHVVNKDYQCKISMNGVNSGVYIHTHVIITGKTPDNGSTQTDVKAYDKNGAVQDWRTAVWGGSPQMVYKRIGPGNDTSNSEKGKDNWKQVSSHVTMDAVYNPGYYLPIIKHRKCEQDFSEDRDRFKSMEVLLKLASTHQAETKLAPPFQTYFSRGNTVSGTVYDPEGKPVKAGVVVRIKPDGWDLPTPVEPVKTNDSGKYKFDKNIETGVYKVFTEDNPEGGEQIEVCNCPQKGETYNKVYDNVDINDQTDLTFLIECNETYTDAIEPLVLEGTSCPAGKIVRKTLGYSVIRIQSKVIKDFFEETYINNVIGAPAEDKDKVISYNSTKYSFNPEEKLDDCWTKKEETTKDFEGGSSTSYLFPERKIDGKMTDAEKFLVDSIWSTNKLAEKLKDKKWNLIFIEGKGLDIELISHKEARPVTLRELKESKEKKTSITLFQEVNYKQGYNTNFVGMGNKTGADFRSAGIPQFFSGEGIPEAMSYLRPGLQQLGIPITNGTVQQHEGMMVFTNTMFGKNKYSGFFESMASNVKIKREITLRPISATEAEKYLTSGNAFEVTGVKTDENIDPDQLKDVLKSLFK